MGSLVLLSQYYAEYGAHKSGRSTVRPENIKKNNVNSPRRPAVHQPADFEITHREKKVIFYFHS